MEEKGPNSDIQNKSENSQNNQQYKDSLFSICINNSKPENEEKKDEKRA